MINIEKLKAEHEEVSGELSLPETIKDREKYQRLAKRFSFLEKVIKLLETRESYLKEKEHLESILADSKEDEEVKGLAQEELPALEKKIEGITEEVEDQIFQEDEPDRDIIIEIRSAAGGEEAALFAASLFKMYSRYIERKGWKLEVLSSSPTEIGGFKEIVFSVKGKGVYTHLKFERSILRLIQMIYALILIALLEPEVNMLM